LSFKFCPIRFYNLINIVPPLLLLPGIPRALVGHKVAVLGLRPTLPPFTPGEFKELIEECWAQDPDKR
jgi:hypothetical protein